MEEFQEVLKEAMKTQLKQTVSSSLDRHSEELARLLQEGINKITDWIWDEEKFRGIEQAAAQGATYMAVNILIDKTTSDAVTSAMPKINEFLNEMRTVIVKATGQAIRELIIESLSEKMEE